MKQLLILSMVLAPLLLSTPAQSADFQTGLDAYENKDYATALAEFAPLAEQGDAKAQSRMGILYGFGRGVPKDDKIAIKWLLLAAEQGEGLAMYNMGALCEDSRASDNVCIKKWFKLSADQGFAKSQYRLGVFYWTGYGREKKNEKTAAKWFTRAAKQGHADAQDRLGDFYLSGIGVPKHRKSAFKWYKLAAEQGHASAQQSLASLYIANIGEDQDLRLNAVLAYMWYSLAGSNGSESARRGLGIIEDGMPSDELEFAQQLAIDCMEQEYKNCGLPDNPEVKPADKPAAKPTVTILDD